MSGHGRELPSAADLAHLAAHGIDGEEAARQLALLRDPPPPIRLVRPCTLGDGILRLEESAQPPLLAAWREAAAAGRLVKFVPASGAASRMFRSLEAIYEDRAREPLAVLRERAGDDPNAAALVRFLDDLRRFAFFPRLARAVAEEGPPIDELLDRGAYRPILAALLDETRLGYRSRPKGLIEFHRYPGEERTAFEEHLVEGAGYLADADGRSRVHFTVAPEARAAFAATLERFRTERGDRPAGDLEVTFSSQSPATDTLAVDPEGRPFRLDSGQLLLRPGGHGSLIGNLEALAADLVVIKNIDNVVREEAQGPVVLWQELLVGLLVRTQSAIFRALDDLADDDLEAARRLLAERFGAETAALDEDSARAALDRPLRVCGVVENRGEPGGGPFWVRGADGSVSAQIVESSQVDHGDPEQEAIWCAATHFNPVDVVCGVSDAAGRPYPLSRYVDPRAVFVSRKSYEGRALVALERPGLWNGAMAGWNTLFVAVPEATFAPVKTVLDLLRPAHQPQGSR